MLPVKSTQRVYGFRHSDSRDESHYCSVCPPDYLLFRCSFFLLSFSVSLLCGWFSCSTTSCPPGGAVWSRGAEWVRASGGRGGRGRAGHGARAGRGNRFGGRIWMTASWHCFILFFASSSSSSSSHQSVMKMWTLPSLPFLFLSSPSRTLWSFFFSVWYKEIKRASRGCTKAWMLWVWAPAPAAPAPALFWAWTTTTDPRGSGRRRDSCPV